MLPRRHFLGATATALALAAAVRAGFEPRSLGAPEAGARPPGDTFQLGMAGYTFNKFKLDPALEMLRRVDVRYLCIKDFHLALKSSDDEIAGFHARLKGYGVTGYGVGPIYLGTEQEVKDSFTYARRVGVKTLVGVPFKRVDEKRVASPELLQLVHDQVREHDIRFAIHNHGPDMPELFPSAESAMALIKNMDRRVGLCLDIGHQFRDGKDPIRAVLDFGDRLHDVHLKNVTAGDKSGRGAELPRGKIDLVGFVRALRRIRYAGICGLEYEKDMDNPLVGLAESVGYFRGIMDATR